MEEYSLPDEVMQHDCNSRAYKEVRDLYAKMPFGYKKAVRAAISAEKEIAALLVKVHKLYPELSRKSLSYNRARKTVFITEEE